MSDSPTRTALFGVFVLARRPLTAGQVISLAAPLGVSATNAKSHLTRMVAEGTLRRSGPRRFARYWPASERQEVIEGIVARLEEPSEERWDGRWLLLALRLPPGRSERDRVRSALWFDGFRPWGVDTYLRPAWPTPWALERASAHLANRSGLCVHGAMLGRLDLRRAREMYRLDALDREARRLAREIRSNRTAVQSPASAFVARLDVGGRVARLVGHDPRLPSTIRGGRTGLRDLVRSYHRFDRRVARLAQRFVDQVVGH